MDRHATRIFAAALLFVATTATLHAESPLVKSKSATTVDHGRLGTFAGITVLELHGTPAERAYAHGYLLADDIITLFDDFALSDEILPDISAYTALILPSQRVRFNWDKYEAELEAMLAGMHAKLGKNKVRSKKLDRAISVDDLMAVNTIADWHGLMCSTITVWGDMTSDMNTLTVRNLDYDYTPTMVKQQLISIVHGDDDHNGYVAVTWPGLIGVYTGVNEKNVTMLSHDSNSLPKSYQNGFTPRGLIFRAALEEAGDSQPFADVTNTFKKHRVMVGNNMHVSTAYNGLDTPARIFEYDSNNKDNGITIRTAEDGDDNLTDAICSTNHVRKRQAPRECRRYGKLVNGLRDVVNENRKLKWNTALELGRRAAGHDTLHTVVFENNKGIMHVLIPAVKKEPVKVPYADWLRKPGVN